MCGNGRSYGKYFWKAKHLFWKNEFANFDKIYNKIPFRNVLGKEYGNKKSIILFGCSFAHGTILDDNQTFGYKLSKSLKRKVYNRAFPGWGVQNMLYQLRRKDFYEQINEEPELVIYCFIGGHLSRLYREVWGFEPQIFYKNTSNRNLEESFFVPGKFPLYGFFAKQIRLLITNNKIKNNKECYDFLLQHFNESKNEINKHWKNTKFVIFVYSYDNTEREILEKIKQKGYNVIFLDEISNINFNTLEYQLSQFDAHPNEKAWDTIVPILVKKLNLK